VTRQSYLRRRCARRYPVHTTTRYGFPLDSPAAVSRLDLSILTRRRIAVTRPRPHSPVSPGSLLAVASLLRAQPRRRSRSHRESTDISEVGGGQSERGHRAGADGSRCAKRSRWFPWQTRPRRTQCGVGADECLVANADCAGTRIPDAPLSLLCGGPA